MELLAVFWTCIAVATFRPVGCENPPPQQPDEIIRMATQEGFPVHRHNVTTADGYQLGLYRMPATTNATASVLLMHGLFSSGADFLTLGPKYSLAYAMLEAGFDVWLANSRGTTFSRAHQTLDPDTDHAFWHYSFHEIGVHDLSASIDYIRAEEAARGGQLPLHYVAHSQGCTALCALLAERPDYNRHLRTVHLMAPAVYMSASQAVDERVIRYAEQLDRLSSRLNLYEVSGRRPELLGLASALSAMCPSGTPLQLLCVNMYFSAFAANLPKPLTRRMARNIYANSPNIVSVRQLIHFAQIIGSGRFRKYDYGEAANRRIYGRDEPPDYELRRLNVSLQVFYGTEDQVVNALDVQRLLEDLDGVVERAVPSIGANHYDFVLSKDAGRKYYGKIVQMVRRSQGLA